MKCPACGKENPAGEQYCLDCGADLSTKPAAAAGAAPPAGGASGTAGESLAMSDAEFQRLLKTPPAPATCPHCGAAAPAGGTFCDNCGESLSAAPAAASVSSAPAAGPTPDQPSAETSTPSPAAGAASPIDQQSPAAAAATAGTPAGTPQSSTAAPSSPAAAQATVTLEVAGPASSSVFTMTSVEAKVGRRDPDAGIYPEIDFDGNDIVVDSGERVHAVSRRHGRIVREGDELKYEDLGSTNGSTLNGAPVLAHDPQPLKDGDTIILGRTCRLAVHIA